MSKPRSLKKTKLKDYLRELSIVIIGIAVTLYAGNLIGNIKVKKDLKFQLTAIYLELEENLKKVDEVVNYYDQIGRLRKNIHSNMLDPEHTSKDSILKYQDIALFTASFNYKKDAYTVFVNSDGTKILSNNNLLLDISKCYSSLEELKQEHDQYIFTKLLIFQEVYKLDKKLIFGNNFDITSVFLNDLYNFHALNSGMETTTKSVKTQIEEVLSSNFKK
ncbi:MAG: hypothetical protein LBP67_00420 [Bacteroidales bacterium]|jgi:hypothetical protein|nr:hypothetical protein [Bacteroidales bacterium]